MVGKTQCYLCKKKRYNSRFAYIPKVEWEMDFSIIRHSICEDCVYPELKAAIYRLLPLVLDDFYKVEIIRNISSPTWIRGNINDILPSSSRIEYILLLCSIILNKNN
jgi:hypothetical protein